MSRSALLTLSIQATHTPVAAKSSVSSSLGPALRDTGFKSYPPPSTWAHPVRRISSSLARGHYFRFGFGPIIRLHLRMEPLFSSARRASPNLHGWLSQCAFAHAAMRADSSGNAVLRGDRTSKVSVFGLDPWPCPSPRAGPFCFQNLASPTAAIIADVRQFLPLNVLLALGNPNVSGPLAAARCLHSNG
jgi:hypothetical protein